MFMHTTYKHLGGILPSQKHSCILLVVDLCTISALDL